MFVVRSCNRGVGAGRHAVTGWHGRRRVCFGVCVNKITGVRRGQRCNQINMGGSVRGSSGEVEMRHIWCKCSINLCTCECGRRSDVRGKEQCVFSWVTGGQSKWSNLLIL